MLDRACVLWRGQNLGSTGPAQVPAYSIAITVLCRVGRESCAECCNKKTGQVTNPVFCFFLALGIRMRRDIKLKWGYTLCTAATSMVNFYFIFFYLSPFDLSNSRLKGKGGEWWMHGCMQDHAAN